MSYPERPRRNKPFVYKAFCAVLIVGCLIVGVIGLVLPIIPGLLFLFLAAILLTRLSSRFEFLLHRNPTLGRWSRKLDMANSLPLAQRTKLVFWLSVRTVVNGLDSLVKIFQKPIKP